MITHIDWRELQVGLVANYRPICALDELFISPDTWLDSFLRHGTIGPSGAIVEWPDASLWAPLDADVDWTGFPAALKAYADRRGLADECTRLFEAAGLDASGDYPEVAAIKRTLDWLEAQR